MIALSVHSFFEGVALGITGRTAALYSLVVGLAIHKSVAAISIGISLSKAFPKEMTQPTILIFIFSISSPVGILFGMFLQGADPVVDVIFSSLAAGTFLYIACSEVIVAEFALPGHRGLKYLALLVGSCGMTSLWFLEQKH